ncbi:MAG TPA: hypothetical protein VG826_29275 [Pirellulales bacterium]|nr:hypothetical protein [Pirellulales bacterium]
MSLPPYRWPVAGKTKGRYYCCGCNLCWPNGFPRDSTLSVTLSGFTTLTQDCPYSCQCYGGTPPDFYTATGHLSSLIDYTPLNATFVAPYSTSVPVCPVTPAPCTWQAQLDVNVPWTLTCDHPCGADEQICINGPCATVNDPVQIVVCGSVVPGPNCTFIYNGKISLTALGSGGPPATGEGAIGLVAVSKTVTKCSPQTLMATFSASLFGFGGTCSPTSTSATITAQFDFSA